MRSYHALHEQALKKQISKNQKAIKGSSKEGSHRGKQDKHNLTSPDLKYENLLEQKQHLQQKLDKSNKEKKMLMQLINHKQTESTSPDLKKTHQAQEKKLELAKQKLKNEAANLNATKTQIQGKTKQINEKLGEPGKKQGSGLNKTVSESQKDSHGAPPKLPLA